MGKRIRVFSFIFSFCLFACTCLIVYGVLACQGLLDRREDLAAQLDTMRGRELKQQAEYGQVVEKLPAALALQAEITPEAQELEASVAALKNTRKVLRGEIALLEQELNAQAEERAELLDTLRSLKRGLTERLDAAQP